MCIAYTHDRTRISFQFLFIQHIYILFENVQCSSAAITIRLNIIGQSIAGLGDRLFFFARCVLPSGVGCKCIHFVFSVWGLKMATTRSIQNLFKMAIYQKGLEYFVANRQSNHANLIQYT